MSNAIAFKMPAAPFVRVMRHVSTDASRPILHGVHIASVADSLGGGLSLCATDGVTLLASRVVPAFADDSAILPTAGVVVQPGKVPAKCATLALSITGRDCVVRFLSDRGLEIGRALWSVIDGSFPAWRNVFLHPDTTSGVSRIGLNPELVGAFAVGGKTPAIPTLHMFGPTRPVVLTWAQFPDDVGMVMPVRTPDQPLTYPPFVGRI